MNPYDIFQLSEDFTEKELKKKYRELCILYHPDKGNEINSNKFLEVQQAYEILSDPVKRKHYDIQRKLPFLESIEFSDQEYELLEHYYSQLVSSNEYKLMSLLYNSIPNPIIESVKQKLLQKINIHKKNHTNNTSLVTSAKWIYIQEMIHSQTIHMYVSMEDSYQNKVKRVFIQTVYGYIYLFLRDFNRSITIDNQCCLLTIHLHTKNGSHCYRKNNDLYYVVPSNKIFHIIHLPDKRQFITKLPVIRNLGFVNENNQRDNLYLVKKIQ